jgi:hypothetical protein
MELRIAECGSGDRLVERQEPLAAARALGVGPYRRHRPGRELRVERRRGVRSRNASGHADPLGGEHVPKTVQKELEERGFPDRACRAVDQPTGHPALYGRMHLGGAHPQGGGELRERPFGLVRESEWPARPPATSIFVPPLSARTRKSGSWARSDPRASARGGDRHPLPLLGLEIRGSWRRSAQPSQHGRAVFP